MDKKQLTIEDIAKLANVHKSTVSRALRGSDLVKPETVEKIQNIVKTYNFRPNFAARALATGGIGSIAIIVPERSISQRLVSPIFPQIIYGVGKVAAEHNYNVTIITTAKDDSDYINLIRNNQANGFIIMGTDSNDTFPYLFQKEQIPFIVIGRIPGMENSVSTNNELGGYLAVKHLLELGHRNITVIGGNERWNHNTFRLQGAKRAYEESGLDFDDCKIIMNQTTIAKSHDTFMELAGDHKQTPDAIFCLSDTAAAGIASAAYDLNVSIPRDLSLVGFGNHYFVDLIRPKLTTIQEEIDIIGEIAAKNLFHMLKNNERTAANVELDPVLIIRESTAPRAK